MRRDTITGLAVLGASLVLFWGKLGLEKHAMVPVGPAFYPRIVTGLTALLGLLLVVLDVAAARRATGRAEPAKPQPNYARVVIAFAVFGGYVLLLPFLGFRVASLLFLLAMPLVFERPSHPGGWGAIVATAIVATIVCHLVFESYLQVLLPRGRWTGF